MKRLPDFKKSLIISLTLALLSFVPTAQANQLSHSVHYETATTSDGKAEKSLYERIGGYNALSAVVDDFIGRLITDPQFSRFFNGFSNDSKKRIRQHIVDQFCEATGGPCAYVGRSMKASHGGIGITENDWNAAAKHLVASLDKFKVPEKEKNEVLAFVTKLKNDIVEK